MTIKPLPDKRGPLSKRKLPAKEHQRLEESVRESDRRKWEAHHKRLRELRALFERTAK